MLSQSRELRCFRVYCTATEQSKRILPLCPKGMALPRAFVKLRKLLSTHKDLAAKLKELEGRVDKHNEAIDNIFEAIRQLMIPEEKPKRRIGF